MSELDERIEILREALRANVELARQAYRNGAMPLFGRRYIAAERTLTALGEALHEREVHRATGS